MSFFQHVSLINRVHFVSNKCQNLNLILSQPFTILRHLVLQSHLQYPCLFFPPVISTVHSSFFFHLLSLSTLLSSKSSNSLFSNEIVLFQIFTYKSVDQVPGLALASLQVNDSFQLIPGSSLVQLQSLELG